MTITTRAGKGSALTYSEGDANWAHLSMLKGAFFNPKDPDFGAVGNGTTNDNSAFAGCIAAAATAGGTVLITHGTFLLSGNHTIAAAVHMAMGSVLTASGSVTITINGPFSASESQHFGANITAVFGIAALQEVLPVWWGFNAYSTRAAALAAADETSAANKAIATGKPIRLGLGFYSATDNLSAIGTIGQHFRGQGKPDGTLVGTGTILVKRSGTAAFLKFTQTDFKFGDFALDGNSLAGPMISMQGAKYFRGDDMWFTGQGGTDYCIDMIDSGVTNLSELRNFSFTDTNYGHLKIRNGLYCAFHNLAMGGTTGGLSILIDSVGGAQQGSGLSFYKTYCDAGIKIIAGNGNDGIRFYDLNQEAITSTPCLEVEGSGIHQVLINGWKILRGASTQPVVLLTGAVNNVCMENVELRETGSLAGFNVIKSAGASIGTVLRNWSVYCNNAFNLWKHTDAGTTHSGTTIQDAFYRSGGAGTIELKGSSSKIIGGNMVIQCAAGNDSGEVFGGAGVVGTIVGDMAIYRATRLRPPHYAQDAEPTLSNAGDAALWTDTNDANRLYFIAKNSAGAQKKVELT